MEQNNGLEGLGNINTNNANPTVSTPYAFLNKVADDSRKLEVNFSKFQSRESLRDYLLNWFSNTCGLECHVATDTELQQTQEIPSLYVTAVVNNGTPLVYKVYCITSSDDLQRFTMLGLQLVCQAKVVLYGNYSAAKLSAVEKQLKQNGIETFSLEDIYDVNSAVDLADKKMPYIGISSSKLSTIVSKVLNNKFKSGGTTSIPGTAGVKGDMNNLTGAFQSGFGQLKDSIVDAVGSLKSMTGHTSQVQQTTDNTQQNTNNTEV